jgi:hypothetical protein
MKASFRYVDRIGARLRYPTAAKERVGKGFSGSQGFAPWYGKLLVWWIPFETETMVDAYQGPRVSMQRTVGLWKLVG